MHAVHEQAQAVSPESSDGLDNKNSRVECNGRCNCLAIMGHAQTFFDTRQKVARSREMAQLWNGSLRPGKAAHAGLRSSSVLLSSLDLSDAPSVRSVPMIILYISRSEPGVRPYPTPAFTSKRPILKSNTA